MMAKLRALARRITGRSLDDGARRIASNTAWLLGERAITLLISLAIQIWTARYLGTTEFGALSYAIAFVGLFGAFSYLGFTGVVTRDLVTSPEAHDEILGTAFVLKVAGGFVGMAAVLGVVAFCGMEAPVGSVSVILALFLPFEAFNVIAFWYQSRVHARPTVIVTACSSAILAAAKGGFILAGMPLAWFAAATGAQTALTSLGLIFIYHRSRRSSFRWRLCIPRAKALLVESWPLALAAVIASVYLKIDQVMLGAFSTVESVAVYAVAARLSEIWYIVPTALATSLFPSIVQSRDLPPGEAAARMKRLYRLMLILALCVSVPVSLLGGTVVGYLYGGAYREAGTILAIHIWACPAIFMGAVFTKWLIAQGFTSFTLMRDGVGAALNVVLNLVMIPRWGGVGAAIATVISYTSAYFVYSFFDRRTREAGRQMALALVPSWLSAGRS